MADMTDMSSGLHTSLFPKGAGHQARPKWKDKTARLLVWFNRIGGAVLVLALIGLASWSFLVDDRLGGEPVASAPIQIAVAADDEPEADGSDFLVDRAPAPDFAGGPRVLQVPQGPVEPASPDLMAQALPGELPESLAGSLSATRGPSFDSRGGLPDIASPTLVQRFDQDTFVPALGPSGERALDAYARPLEAGTIAPGQPRIAIIMGGLGLSQSATQDVINRMPPAMTLSFAPYGNSLERWTSRARQNGHEYLIEVPMEPFDYPNNDPGPHTLLASLDEAANLERMHWALSRVSTPVGLMNYMGGRFSSEEALVRPVVADAVQRGLMVVDDGRSARSRMASVAGQGAPVLRADVVIDARLDDQSINNRLAQLEALAREHGQAVGVASALPLSIDALEEWSTGLAAKGIALVPVSSLVRF